MAHYPILFSRRDGIQASHFTASVTVAGRVLVTDEAGEFWVEGVNPGGLAAKGATVTLALNAFCESYREVLLDIAEDEASFEGFKKAVERFFADTNMAAAEDWDTAVLDVRAGRLTMAELGKRPSESPIAIKVRLVKDRTQEEASDLAKNEEVSDVAMAA